VPNAIQGSPTQQTTFDRPLRLKTEVAPAVQSLLQKTEAMAADRTNSDAEVGGVLMGALQLSDGERAELAQTLDGFGKAVSDDGLAAFLKVLRGDVYRGIKSADACDGELTTQGSLQVAAGVLADGKVDKIEKMSVAAALLMNKMTAAARTNLHALIREPRTDLPEREFAAILEKSFDAVRCPDDVFIQRCDLERVLGDHCASDELKDACASALHNDDAFTRMETAHWLGEPDGKASRADLQMFMDPPRTDMTLVECARALKDHFVARGLGQLNDGELLALRADFTASKEARGAAATLHCNPALFEQIETAAYGAGTRDHIVGMVDLDKILNPFPVYGADWYWGRSEGMRKYRFQPDADGWISDHFFKGNDHAQVYYNVVTKQFEAREVGHGRDQPLLADQRRATAAIGHARNTIFNDAHLYIA
jgi:hypothetical protein